MFKRAILYIWELLKVAIITIAIIVPIRYFLIIPFYVKGESMIPNFHDREYLIVDEISYRFREPQRGEVIVFRYPKNPQEYFIKRVIGLPGESVKIKDNGVYIYNKENPDGLKLNESYLPAGTETLSNTYYSESKVAINDKQYLVLGDNRMNSMDSRSFGPIDKSFVVGKVLLRGLPLNKITLFKEAPKY
ncbi:MAG: signal peptidase I [Candidatus Falkowbacteria bacterium]|nr:signal peptidase I [Candidatus Falkowbacteria bacterium]